MDKAHLLYHDSPDRATENLIFGPESGIIERESAEGSPKPAEDEKMSALMENLKDRLKKRKTLLNPKRQIMLKQRMLPRRKNLLKRNLVLYIIMRRILRLR